MNLREKLQKIAENYSNEETVKINTYVSEIVKKAIQTAERNAEKGYLSCFFNVGDYNQYDIRKSVISELDNIGLHAELSNMGHSAIKISWDYRTRTISGFYEEYVKWANKTFGTGRHSATLEHLRREAIEARENPDDKTEFADCLMLLLHAWSSAHPEEGIEGLLRVANEKLEINKSRKWKKPDELGVVEHEE